MNIAPSLQWADGIIHRTARDRLSVKQYPLNLHCYVWCVKINNFPVQCIMIAPVFYIECVACVRSSGHLVLSHIQIQLLHLFPLPLFICLTSVCHFSCTQKSLPPPPNFFIFTLLVREEGFLSLPLGYALPSGYWRREDILCLHLDPPEAWSQCQ